MNPAVDTESQTASRVESQPRVTVVILNWNGLAHMPECMDALDAQVFKSFRVCIVDNASTDGSVEWVRQNRPDVELIVRADNGGFAAGVNTGIHAATTEFVALLNNDTMAEPDWLQELVGALDAYPCYASAASRMMLFYEPGLVNAAGDVFSYWRLAGINRGLGEPVAGYLERSRVFGACAGASIYRREFFDKVGLFDEDFFLLHEDTDINLRAVVAGLRCIYVPEAVVQHKHHGSLGVQPQRPLQIREWRNKAALSSKSLPDGLRDRAPFVLALALLRWVLPLRPRNWHLAPQRLWMLPAIGSAAREGWADGKRKRAAVLATAPAGGTDAEWWIRHGVGPLEECE